LEFTATNPAARSRRIRVLLMVRELGIGGTERQAAATAFALDRRLFDPHVMAFRAYGFRAEELREAGIPVAEIPAPSLWGPSALTHAFALGRYIRDFEIDIVHTFDTPMNLFGVPVARFFRAPVVLSSQRAYRDLTPPRGRKLLWLTDRLVDGVVVNCEALRQHMEHDQFNPPARNLLCRNGIDTLTYRLGDSPRPPALPAAGLTVGVLCGLRPEKDLGVLLHAFANFRRTRPEALLALVGSGPSLEGLQRLAEELSLGPACHFEPATSDVAPWLRAMDIFVLPSRSEALSNALMEAMACGCCPVASNVGGNPELVAPMETGLLFRQGDAADLASKLEILAADPALRRRLAARAAAKIASEFSLEAAGRRMAQIYLSFLPPDSPAKC
jgi:glycosyltransferase involved in cell wall biosynthesis